MRLPLDRKKKILMAVSVAVAVAMVLLLGLDFRERRAYRKAEAQHQEMVSLSQQYLAMRSGVDRIEKRIGLSSTESLPIAVENIVAGMGLKGKLQSVKPFGGGTRENYEIQEAEVVIDKLTVNELVNVLYGFYTVPAGLFVTSSEYKRDFSDRRLINARLSLKLISLKQQEGKQ
jgi:hypothetical protein